MKKCFGLVQGFLMDRSKDIERFISGSEWFPDERVVKVSETDR